MDKVKMANLGKTYAYILMYDNHNVYAPNKQLVLFANKLDAMVVKKVNPSDNLRIVKFNELDNRVKNLLLLSIERGNLQVGVILGYITSEVNQRTQFVVGNNGVPLFHFELWPSLVNIDDGIDLADYLRHSVSDEVNEEKLIQHLIFSNLCSDNKLQEVAEEVIQAAKADGLQTEKQISIRHIFASENTENDLEIIWGGA